ncbi:arginine/ornithine succinyltransferase subunit [Marinobacter santoriniensis NKSG1]|uniref:Arginine/ornithine succinyltransferase subunit n=1 Tax=Marinobacter santoriniensis NKSG1 TaxID=1288826 RepID=M7CV01_9GAMM|nr:arginine N-succinyltransferase [Marinobacter santoriniensis]EMP56939.1 arginine/ornithine succinyltransferase subunit [Marinobacter santoriniensis NKSG1]
MLILRPANFADLQGIERLAAVAGGSLTTLPANRDYLSELIERTTRSLRKSVDRPGTESYHFVLEDSDSQEIVGVSGIEAAVGLGSPFYSYRIEDVVRASNELQIHNRIPALHLCQDYIGSSRLCTLYLEQPYRSEDNLRLLSLARLLFIAAHSERFAPRIIAELQGVTDERGRSPFWESLGRHFFNMELRKANYLTGIDSKSFIADLLPQHPVYLPLLSKEARDALGRPREDAIEVQSLLETQGFAYRKYIDIFDAGPTLEAPTHMLRALTHSQILPVNVVESIEAGDTCRPALISNEGLDRFRCLRTVIDPGNPELGRAEAEALGVGAGDNIRVYWLDRP